MISLTLSGSHLYSSSFAAPTTGLSPAYYESALPWFDVWLPARFRNLYILPVLVVQQVGGGVVAHTHHLQGFTTV